MDRVLQELGLSWREFAMACFLAGVWWSERRSSTSRRDQGKRIGDVEKQLAKLLAAPGASRSDGQ